MADTPLHAKCGEYRGLEGHMSEETIPIRLSHLLRECSVGSIVRGEQYLVAVNDARSWYPKEQAPTAIQYVERVKSALGISEELWPPPTARITDEGKIEGTWIPAVRFPKWMHCPHCGLLHYIPWQNKKTETAWFCLNRANGECNRKLEQVPWIMVHEKGYMADAPWHMIAHDNINSNGACCTPDWGIPYLRLFEQNGQHRLRCFRCKNQNPLPDRFPYTLGTWQQPWIREATPRQPEELAWLLSINDVRVHESWTSTALVIPPESRIRKGTVMDRLYCNTRWQRELKRAKSGLKRKTAFQNIARQYRCSVDEIEDALQEIDRGYPLYGQTTAGGELLQGEYHALINPLPELSEDEDFVTAHHSQAWKSIRSDYVGIPRRAIKAIDRLIEVRRLKEIMVMRGFRRLNSAETLSPDITGETGWLPALELYGEGVFFTLEESILQSWEQQPALQNRATVMAQRAGPVSSSADKTEVSPRFLLLHTLAHLLIRKFETEAGYPAASLKERIYCASGSKPMAGILIYVAVPDEVGSLGGLGDITAPKRFLRFIVSAFEAATWCSLDPVCGDHAGRGPNLLNRAACHACVLIPEPSCAYGNELLDRSFVKREDKEGISALLDFAGGDA